MSSPFLRPTTGQRPLAIRESLSIRGYATLVVALAAFLASMVALRVPFRGYLVEARLAGRLGDGLDRPTIEKWLKSAARGVSVRVEADAGGRCDVVLQQIAPRAGDAQLAMDRVTRQFAEQFVVQRREASRQIKLARLQAELQTARDTEDSLRNRLEEIRNRQEPQTASLPSGPELASPTARAITPTPAATSERVANAARLRERLEALQVELAGLLGNFTEAHPKVITLRSQIAGLESELLDKNPAARNEAPSAEAVIRRSSHGTSIPAESTSQQTAEANLAAATRARQWAERQLQTEVETLASTPGFPWAVESARVLARVGGTPRALTLIAAGIITLIAAGLMLWASAALVPRLLIHTADELTALLDLPLAGRAPALGQRRKRGPRIAPATIQAALHGAEVVLGAMFLALAFTMVSDRWLAGQVLVDPFGVLSEVAGRLLG